MNSHLFHLSYLRVDNTRPFTGYDGLNNRISQEFRRAWTKFRNELPEPHKSEFIRQVDLSRQPDENGQPSVFRDLDLN